MAPWCDGLPIVRRGGGPGTVPNGSPCQRGGSHSLKGSKSRTDGWGGVLCSDRWGGKRVRGARRPGASRRQGEWRGITPAVWRREAQWTFAGCSPSPPPRRRTVGHLHVAVAATEFLQHLLPPLLPRRRTLGPPDPAQVIVALIGRAPPVLRHQSGGQQGAADVDGHGVARPAQRGGLAWGHPAAVFIDAAARCWSSLPVAFATSPTAASKAC